MEILQRLQPLDVMFAVLWASIIGWGLQAGVIRKLGMLVGVYGGAILSGSLYRPVGQSIAMAFGREYLPQFEFAAYVGLFVVTLGVIGLVAARAYPATRMARTFGADNVFGAAVAAIWGVLLLIALLTILRFYAVIPWRDQEATQRSVASQVALSQSAPVLEVIGAPLWTAMAAWFPSQVTVSL